jgi:hypothetical protein
MTMDVDREVRAANRRIQRQIDASAREALIRIGVDPDAEAHAARLEAMAAIGTAFGQALIQLGELATSTLNAFADAFEALEAEEP